MSKNGQAVNEVGKGDGRKPSTAKTAKLEPEVEHGWPGMRSDSGLAKLRMAGR